MTSASLIIQCCIVCLDYLAKKYHDKSPTEIKMALGNEITSLHSKERYKSENRVK